MQNLKTKMVFLLVTFVIVSFALGISVYASNEKVQIVKKSNTDYLIYVEGCLDNSFEFAFSDDNTVDKTTLTHSTAAKDDVTDGNYIAFINQYTTEHKYMWVKNAEGTYILNAVELDLTKAIDAEELETIQNVTKTIKADTAQVKVEEKDINGSKVKVTTGKVVLKDEGNYEYQIVKLPNGTEYARLMDLAKRISKFDNEINLDMYTKLEVYNEFNSLYRKLSSELVANNWKDVQNQEILQPEDTKNGDEYVLWIRKDGTVYDAQFLTSKYEEEKVTEKITTKLPVTYDNNILLVILGILVIAIIIVSLRIKSLEKNNK